MIKTTVLFTCFIYHSVTFSQNQKDTLFKQLPEIEIGAVKNKLLGETKKAFSIDSINKRNFNTVSVGDLLAVNSTVFIKNYGPAALSSVSLRGGNASQSPVLWNGFNIQNPMLGQNDFSQLPSFIFDEAIIEYGGSSALWGSGAMGGSIHLNNKNIFRKGFSTLLNVSLGSYETKKLNTLLHFSNSKISSNTKVYYLNSKNNFEFRDTVIKKQEHSDYLIKGLLQELSFLPFTNQKINIRAWYHQSFRNLPAPVYGKISQSSQSDENLKLTGEWIYEGKKLTPALRVAYFNDQLNYHDSLAGIFSDNNTKTLIAETDFKYLFKPNHTLFAGGNATTNKVLTSNYSANNSSLNRQALLLGYSWNGWGNKLLYQLQIRKEFCNIFEIPITGNTGLSYLVIKQLKLLVNAAKIYRIPTMNDLYWINGGNPNLKPEEGYSFDGGFDLKVNYESFNIESKMTYYNKNIYNWIVWVPGQGTYPQARNLMQVFSRGTETSNSISYKQNNLLFKLGFNTAYTLSTSEKSELANDEAVHKQLIYTPRYNYGGNITFVLKKFIVSYYHNYIGYRFTSSDNSTWLNPYQVANLKVSDTFNINTIGVTVGFGINNLYNENYFVVNQRYMPLRNYEVSITLNYHKPLNNKKTS